MARIVEAFKSEVLNQFSAMSKQMGEILEGSRLIEARLKRVEDRLTDLENYSRRENLVFFGIQDDGAGETWEVTETKVTRLIKEKLGVEADITFQRVHRLGKARNGPNARPVIARFLLYKQRQQVLKNAYKLKDSNYSISEDFCKTTRDFRKMLVPHLKAAKRGGRRAHIKIDTLFIDDQSYVVVGNTVKNSKTGAPLHLVDPEN